MKSRIAMMAISLVLLSASSASAAGLQGTLTFTGLGGTKNTPNLLNVTLFTFTNYSVNFAGTGNFSGVPLGTTFTGQNPPIQTGALDITTPTTMSGFKLINPNFGTFVASNISGNMILTNPRVATALTVKLSGVFTPSGSLGTFSPSPAEVIATFGMTGTSGTRFSSEFVLTVVPEPSTYALGAVSTCAIGALTRRKRRVVSRLV